MLNHHDVNLRGECMTAPRLVLMVTLTAGLLAAPLAAGAQHTAGKVYRIGILGQTSPAVGAPLIRAFRQGLRELGWVDQNIALEERWTDGKLDPLPDLAAELVRLRVDVIIVGSVPSALAAKQATTTIPIVLAGVPSPVATGLVASLARPGGNITGVSSSVTAEIAGKHLELLKEAAPKVSRVAVLSNPTDPGMARYLKQVEVGGQAMGVTLKFVEARGLDDLENTFAAIIRERAGGLLVADPFLLAHQVRVIDFAAKHRLPVIYAFRQFVDAGGLMYYGPHLGDLLQRTVTYVDKILKGAKPADLPVEQPTRFELVVNLKTANALGLAIPPSVLLRADQVIK